MRQSKLSGWLMRPWQAPPAPCHVVLADWFVLLVMGSWLCSITRRGSLTCASGGLHALRVTHAQGPGAAPQPPNRRNWPPHGLECPLQSHIASPLAASVAEAKMQVVAGGSVCWGQFVSGWTRSPILEPLSVRKFPQAVTEAGMPSIQVPAKACLRACGTWMRAPVACCSGKAADRRVWRSP